MSVRLFLLGASVATAGLMLVPGVAAAVARAGRPAMRSAMKSGASAYHEVRRAGAEAYEHFEDMAAEVRAEMTPGAPPPHDDEPSHDSETGERRDD
ncbi:hypothetical protein GCM10011316_07730 [Roseibium aquae]|uniref:DUF5132 domain-containing protein n=1 Tax=Roseibium aquae TaxID=1323746 RepID=A0A916TBE4_9HYPH|nr:DUF5132 domain-containing protein [Roseibium aquae]GGB38122.1 hypothetical protein GCM10011316_07730 [Roseibium aquae]